MLLASERSAGLPWRNSIIRRPPFAVHFHHRRTHYCGIAVLRKRLLQIWSLRQNVSFASPSMPTQERSIRPSQFCEPLPRRESRLPVDSPTVELAPRDVTGEEVLL
jgi:hypothetical protein